MASAIAAAAPAQSPSLFSNRTFAALWIGQAVSVVGDGFHSVALGLWVLQSTGSAAAMASIMTMKAIIQVALGSVAGAVVDRSDRRRLMLGMDAARFLLVGAIAWLVARGGSSLLPIVVLTGLISICGNFFGPAFQASLTNIVEQDQLQKATGLLQVTNTLAGVVGPALGGAVVAAFGGGAALLVDAISFLVGAVMIYLGGAFPSPRSAANQHQSLLADMKEGFAYIKRDPLIGGAFMAAPFLNFFAAGGFLLLPVIAVKVWNASAGQYGAMQAAFPLGFALGGLLIMTLAGKMRRRGWWMSAGIIVTGIGFTAAALSGATSYAMPVLLVVGFFNAVTNVILMVIMQKEVPAEVQGRVFGTLNSVCGVANPIAMMTAGLLADRMNPVLLGGIAGLGMIATGIAMVAVVKAVRNYN